jgi:site-specific recombinase XerD
MQSVRPVVTIFLICARAICRAELFQESEQPGEAHSVWNIVCSFRRTRKEDLMTPLRKRMLEEMKRRNLSKETARIYVTQMATLAKHFRTSPDKLSHDQLRSYQLHMIDKGVTWSTYNTTVCAMRFFYGKVLGRQHVVERLPYAKTPKRLPVILSRGEVRRLWEAADRPWHAMIVKTLYACGLRVSEGVGIEIRDLDGERHTLHLRGAKGAKDRYVPLVNTLLSELRAFWRTHRNPRWLFPSTQSPARRAGRAAVLQAIKTMASKAGINKGVSCHTLRHAAATHWLEANVPLPMIQHLLGHTSPKTTSIYLHVTDVTSDARLRSVDLLAQTKASGRCEGDEARRRFTAFVETLTPEQQRVLFGDGVPSKTPAAE